MKNIKYNYQKKQLEYYIENEVATSLELPEEDYLDNPIGWIDHYSDMIDTAREHMLRELREEFGL